MEKGFVDVLILLAQGLGVGAVVSFLFEKMDWFQAVSSKARYWIILALSLGLPLGATILLQVIPADAWAVVEPYWKALAAGFLVWAGSQGTHLLFQSRNGG